MSPGPTTRKLVMPIGDAARNPVLRLDSVPARYWLESR